MDIEKNLVLFTAFYVGACLGSFINVVIYRLPKMMEQGWLSECVAFLREYLYDQTITKTGSGALSVKNETTFDTALPTPENAMLTPTVAFPFIADERRQTLITLLDKVEEEQKLHASSATFNLAFPRSHCPSCGTIIPISRNLPLITWLLQRGKAQCCGAPISPRYFVVELLGALLTLLAFWFFGGATNTLTLSTSIAASGFLLVLLTLSGIDLETRLLPDSLTLPLLWAGLLANLFHLFTPLTSAVMGAVLGYGILWLLYQGHYLITKREGMGFGDFKLTAAFGAWMGWKAVPIILFIAAIVGLALALMQMRVRHKPREEPIAFGPSLCVSAVIVLFYGKPIITWLGY